MWVFAIVASLVLVLTLLVAALVVLIVKRQPHYIRLNSENGMRGPKVVDPDNMREEATHTERDRRWQDRRRKRDRRKRYVPVAIERRTGLARRRSELIDDGHATVSTEVVDPIAEAEAYIAGGSYSHAEAALEEAITNDPGRLDLKIKLLEVYQHSGNETAFRTLANHLRPALEESDEGLQLERDVMNNGSSSDEILSGENASLDNTTTLMPATPTQQKSGDSDRQTAVCPETDDGLVEWEPIDVPTGVASGATPIAAEGERQIEPPRQRGTTASDTLEQAFTDFLHARKALKPRTIDGYKKIMAAAFADWHEKPLFEISTEIVAKRHQELSEDRGTAYANRAMRFLRTLYNFALPRYQGGSKDLVFENPVKCL